mmetsp:Transcript_5090/g.12333  ORF Transcript_5090/g.12333 Transcript_5090/m.12333 type:complete len:273 (+) Transcript_5090:35-853(+)
MVLTHCTELESIQECFLSTASSRREAVDAISLVLLITSTHHFSVGASLPFGFFVSHTTQRSAYREFCFVHEVHSHRASTNWRFFRTGFEELQTLHFSYCFSFLVVQNWHTQIGGSNAIMSTSSSISGASVSTSAGFGALHTVHFGLLSTLSRVQTVQFHVPACFFSIVLCVLALRNCFARPIPLLQNSLKSSDFASGRPAAFAIARKSSSLYEGRKISISSNVIEPFCPRSRASKIGRKWNAFFSSAILRSIASNASLSLARRFFLLSPSSM